MGFEYSSSAASTAMVEYRSNTSIKKAIFSSEEIVVRKKVLELHAHDGSVFNTESLLVSIEGILNHVFAVDAAGNEEQGLTYEAVSASDFPDTLSYLLHEIICVLNCKCSRGDGHAATLEILQLLACYNWEAKIAIILASFMVEYGHYSLAASCYTSNNLGKIVAMLKQTLHDGDTMRSKFQSILTLVTESIKTTRVIAQFGSFSSKHISKDDELIVDALNHIPILVYYMTRSVVACASEYSVILGKSESTYSSTETWSTTSIEKRITTIRTTLESKYEECYQRIEEKKQIKYCEKLKGMFSSTRVYKENQKILQTIIKSKDGSIPLSCGPQAEKRRVETLKGKTVLLLISDLTIKQEEITRIKYFYESRSSTTQYEIVWLPIVEKIEKTEEFEAKVTELKCSMPWPALDHPCLIRPGFVKYVKEEWSYSKESIIVSIDKCGKMTNKNVFDMMMTWGNTVFPFSYGTESKLLKQHEWSLKLLVEETTQEMSTWMSEDKLICLFGGHDHGYIKEFITAAKQVESVANKKLQMVYIYNKNQEHITTEIQETFTTNSVVVWDKSTSTYFWKRMESMMCSKVKRTTVVSEVASVVALGHHESGWGLLSVGAGARVGSLCIAKAKGDLMVRAFGEFSASWSTRVERVEKVGVAMAFHEHLLELHKIERHQCEEFEFRSTGFQEIHGIKVCSVCRRVMKKRESYSCFGEME